MTVTCGSRSRAHRISALSATVASLLSCGVFSVHAQAPQAIPAAQAAPARGEKEQYPLQPAETPTVGVTGNPSPVVEPPPPPPPPSPLGPGAGPALIPDGEAPPGPVAPAFPPIIPNIDYAGRLRIGFLTNDTRDPKTKGTGYGFGDLGSELAVDMYFAGQIHRWIKWQAGITGSYSGAPGSSNSALAATGAGGFPGRELGTNAQILDVIARFEFMPEFNVYAGRMIVLADRYTPSGPWGMDEYIYPGFFPGTAVPALQRSGPVGRDLGVNVWGAIPVLGGSFKYYAGAYQFSDPALSPLLSGRVQLSLLTPEPGFYQRTTYYGYKDLISVGIGAQYQHDGSVAQLTIPGMMEMDGMPATPTTFQFVKHDYAFFTGDVVVDKNFTGKGTLSFVASATKFWGDFGIWKSHYLVSLGWLFPQVIGVGKFRPALRFQSSTANGTDKLSWIMEAQVGYVIMPWFARLALGYRAYHTELANAEAYKGNQVFLGITIADP